MTKASTVKKLLKEKNPSKEKKPAKTKKEPLNVFIRTDPNTQKESVITVTISSAVTSWRQIAHTLTRKPIAARNASPAIKDGRTSDQR